MRILARPRAIVIGRSLLVLWLLASMVITTDVARAATTTTPPTAEAWYRYTGIEDVQTTACDAGIPAPGCEDDALGTGSPTSVNPYPEATLHVSINAGRDDTITYLQLAAEPTGAPIVEGLLVLPIAPTEDGTANPNLARFEACLVTEAIEDQVAAGAPTTAPAFDCEVSSRAIFVAPDDATQVEDLGVFEVDLLPFAAQFAAGVPAIALVPTDGARSESDTWHVAFNGRDREVAEDRLVRATLVTPAPQVTPQPEATQTSAPAPEPTATAAPAPVPTPAPAPAPVTTLPGSSFGSFTGVTANTAPVAVAPVEQPTAAPAPQIAAPGTPATTDTIAAPAFVTISLPIGLAYPAVFAAPLALLLLGALASSSLVRPLQLPERSRP